MTSSLRPLTTLVILLVHTVHPTRGFLEDTDSPDHTLITSPWGLIRGEARTTRGGREYTSFEGLPYAHAPVQKLRFIKPSLYEKHNGPDEYDATRRKPICMLPSTARYGSADMSEDCLYLDIYVPKRNGTSTEPLQVMVYIHGGGFVFYGRPDPTNFIEKGVITVIIQYRLGILGFLSTEDDNARGNYGLWDQHMALLWLKNNIAAFGGDEDSITVFGESAGSASVSYQLLSPYTKDTFKRAIMQSGTATSAWAFHRNPAKRAIELGKIMNCSQDGGNAALVDCLRRKSAKEITEATRLVSRNPYQKVADFMFGPTVDGDFVLREPLELIRDPSYLQQVGLPHKDLIVGFLNNEGSLLIYRPSCPRPPDFGDFFQKTLVPGILEQRFGVTSPQAEKLMDDFYRNQHDLDTLHPMMTVDAYADPAFNMPGLEFAQGFSKSQKDASGPGKTYFYFFNYCPPSNGLDCMRHGNDMDFLFPGADAKHTSEFDKISSELTDRWINFATTSHPSSVHSDVTWPEFDASGQYIVFSRQTSLSSDMFPQRAKLWFETLPMVLNYSGAST